MTATNTVSRKIAIKGWWHKSYFKSALLWHKDRFGLTVGDMGDCPGHRGQEARNGAGLECETTEGRSRPWGGSRAQGCQKTRSPRAPFSLRPAMHKELLKTNVVVQEGEIFFSHHDQKHLQSPTYRNYSVGRGGRSGLFELSYMRQLFLAVRNSQLLLQIILAESGPKYLHP